MPVYLAKWHPNLHLIFKDSLGGLEQDLFLVDMYLQEHRCSVTCLTEKPEKSPADVLISLSEGKLHACLQNLDTFSVND